LVVADYAEEQVSKMAVHTHCLVLTSTYRDSVMLMQLSRTLENLSGMCQAGVMMGTPQNKALLREAGLLPTEGEQAGANDLLICVQADTQVVAEGAVHEARQRLSHHQMAVDDVGETAPRTLETALRRMPEANLACISVPGQYARHEARKAIQHGLHVFLFSDHVDLEAEKELKQLAVRQGLLVMGPDCGTAIFNGVPLGFANQVSRGPVGLISASGTGLQQVMCLLAQQGIGISQAIGVGGRDLHQHIGGCSMRAALQALASDTDTQVIVLISKPPEAAVAARLARQAAHVGKPCVLAFLGGDPWPTHAATLYSATTLEDAALIAGALVRGEPVSSSPQGVPPHLMPCVEATRATLQPGQQTIRALYCGGTLAYEALWLLRRSLEKVDSNLDGTITSTGRQKSATGLSALRATNSGWSTGDQFAVRSTSSGEFGHVVLDLGAEEFTRGRPHPMIDPAGRRQQLLEAARQPEVAVVLCDVILGWGAHHDPAGMLVAAWQEARELARASGRNLVGIATVCGTPDDPQGYTRQCEVVREHGLLLADSNAQAVRLAASVVGNRAAARHAGPPMEATEPAPSYTDEIPAPEVPVDLSALCTTGPRVINLGLELFVAQLAACSVPVVHVDWRPPAGGDERLANLLERLR
jgi:FdrA protein